MKTTDVGVFYKMSRTKTDDSPKTDPFFVRMELERIRHKDTSLSHTEDEKKRVEGYTSPLQIHKDYVMELCSKLGGFRPNDPVLQFAFLSVSDAIHTFMINYTNKQIGLLDEELRVAKQKSSDETVLIKIRQKISSEKDQFQNRQRTASLIAFAVNRRMEVVAARYGFTMIRFFHEVNAFALSQYPDSNVPTPEQKQFLQSFMKENPKSWWNNQQPNIKPKAIRAFITEPIIVTYDKTN